jgi:hypothetical protein
MVSTKIRFVLSRFCVGKPLNNGNDEVPKLTKNVGVAALVFLVQKTCESCFKWLQKRDQQSLGLSLIFVYKYKLHKYKDCDAITSASASKVASHFYQLCQEYTNLASHGVENIEQIGHP